MAAGDILYVSGGLKGRNALKFIATGNDILPPAKAGGFQ